MPKFYFTYGSDERFPYQHGWTEIEAPDRAMACAAFRHYHPDRDPEVRCLNCADVYSEAEFGDTVEWMGVNWRDRCHERIMLTREPLDDWTKTTKKEQALTLTELEALPDGTSVWVESEWMPTESGYRFVQHINGYTLLIHPHDFPTRDGCVPHLGTDSPDGGGYGETWTAYRNKPGVAVSGGGS